MRCNRSLLVMVLVAAACLPPKLAAASFGSVVPIGGHASDIALNESRGLLYIANFTANRIDVMSTADNTIRSAMPTPAQPGSLALSLDGTYLAITSYAGWNDVSAPNANTVTIINLASNDRQTIATADPPLAAAFVAIPGSSPTGLALIATTTGFYLLDPVTGALQSVATFANLAQKLPAPQATFPGQVLQTAMTAAPGGGQVWGIADGGTGSQLIYLFDAATQQMTAEVWKTSPPLLPRVSVTADASAALIGWAVFTRAQCGSGFMIRSRYPGAAASPNVTGHAIDSKSNTIYAQIFDPTQPNGPPYTPSTPAGQAPPAKLPALSILDADNLTVRERLYLPENLTGRALLNSAATVMYAISDSGVTILPVGSRNNYKRLVASAEDLLISSNFCNRSAVTQTFTLMDPGGNRTEFSISAARPGVTVSPSSGVTPATITVTIDPQQNPSTSGTLAIPLQITSPTAVNQPPTVRLLISSPDQDQRGTIVNVPGVLTDVLADPIRNQYYVIRQDKNQVLVFDGSNNQQKAVLRTGTTPVRMSFSSDAKSLIVASTDSQLLQVYDLDSLQPEIPVMLPPGHYGRSVAPSNAGSFAVVENDATGSGSVDRFDLVARCATTPPALGIWENSVPPASVLAPSPSQSSILLAEPDGHLMLYSAPADSWVLSRQDFPSLSGAYAAADPPAMPSASEAGETAGVGVYVVGDHIFNASLVPIGTLDTAQGGATGFAFSGVAQAGFRLSGSTASAPGALQALATLPASPSDAPALRTVEAPVLPGTALPFTRTLALLPSAGAMIALTTSGVILLPSSSIQPPAMPSVSKVVSAADDSSAVAPGGLIRIYGANLASVPVPAGQLPLPFVLGQSCLLINGSPAPLIFVSSGNITAQLPSQASGDATLTVHTPGGISNSLSFTVSNSAPSIFMSGAAGPVTGLATIFRVDNRQLVTPTNPIHENDTILIYLTGLGATSPAVPDGMPAPASPLANALFTPSVTLGGKELTVLYAGLVPGEVGVYQINALVPSGVPQGLNVPLIIRQGESHTTASVRVVK